MRQHGKFAMWELVLLMYDKGVLPEPMQESLKDAYALDDKDHFWKTLMGEVTDRFLNAVQDLPPQPKRGLEGDLNPCEICGNFGGFQVGDGWGIMLCRKHKAWWDEERAKYAEKKGV